MTASEQGDARQAEILALRYILATTEKPIPAVLERVEELERRVEAGDE